MRKEYSYLKCLERGRSEKNPKAENKNVRKEGSIPLLGVKINGNPG